MSKVNNQTFFPEGKQLPKKWFTGNAYLTPLIGKNYNNEFSVGSVYFEPGARTNWHTHPKGQVLIVIEGSGLYQEKGRTPKAIGKGDVVSIPENTEHWHGATTTDKMEHIAITNYLGDEQVTWLKKVTDQQYREAHQL